MNRRYTLAPDAACDLAQIWRYMKKQTGEGTADVVESVIRGKIALLSQSPFIGHARPDMTTANVRFFLVYSYFIVYPPETRPLQVVSILHSKRDLSPSSTTALRRCSTDRDLDTGSR